MPDPDAADPDSALTIQVSVPAPPEVLPCSAAALQVARESGSPEKPPGRGLVHGQSSKTEGEGEEGVMVREGQGPIARPTGPTTTGRGLLWTT